MCGWEGVQPAPALMQDAWTILTLTLTNRNTLAVLKKPLGASAGPCRNTLSTIDDPLGTETLLRGLVCTSTIHWLLVVSVQPQSTPWPHPTCSGLSRDPRENYLISLSQ